MSDLSAFHRVDDPDTLDIPRLIGLAARLSAYQGACRARFARSAGTASPAGVASTASSPPVGGGGGDTPPEVIAMIKRNQFAARHQADPGAIEWDNDAVYRELVGG